MKNGKLEMSDVGKKFKGEAWHHGQFVILIGFRSDGEAVYEDERGQFRFYKNTDWLPYEEVKQTKRIEAAPCVIKTPEGIKISMHNYISKEACEEDFMCDVIKYPADWDDVKKCWFYEWEE